MPRFGLAVDRRHRELDRAHRVDEHVLGREGAGDGLDHPQAVGVGDVQGGTVDPPLAVLAVAADVDVAQTGVVGVALAELGPQGLPAGQEGLVVPVRGRGDEPVVGPVDRARAGLDRAGRWGSPAGTRPGRRAAPSSSRGSRPRRGSRTCPWRHRPSSGRPRCTRSRRRPWCARAGPSRSGRGSTRRLGGRQGATAGSGTPSSCTGRAAGWRGRCSGVQVDFEKIFVAGATVAAEAVSTAATSVRATARCARAIMAAARRRRVEAFNVHPLRECPVPGHPAGERRCRPSAGPHGEDRTVCAP